MFNLILDKEVITIRKEHGAGGEGGNRCETELDTFVHFWIHFYYMLIH